MTRLFTQVETHQCPDRMGKPPGPYGSDGGPDYWDRDRWHGPFHNRILKLLWKYCPELLEFFRVNLHPFVFRLLQKVNAPRTLYQYFITHPTTWPEGSPIPRICSYCGGIHPEDAMELITLGWELEPTGKHYKRYMHPHGAKEHVDKLCQAIRDRVDPDWTFVDASPPVKLYTWHFTEAQAEQFNTLVHQHAPTTEFKQ